MQENQQSPSHTIRHDLITETQEFWKERTGVELTKDEAREALQNMAAFVALVSEWSAIPDPTPGQNEQEG